MTKKRKLAYAALLLNAIIWGAALPIVKPSLEFVTPSEFLFFRYLVASILGLPILIILLWRNRLTFKTFLTIAGFETMILGLGHFMLYQGLSRTSSLEAALIASTSPILVILGGIWFLKEKQEKHEWQGLALALFGTLIIVIEPLVRNGNGANFTSLVGNLFVVGYNLIWTVYLLSAKKIYKGVSKILIGFLGPWFAMLFHLLVVGFNNPMIIASGQLLDPLAIPSVLMAMLFMAIFGSVLAVPLIMYGNEKIESSEATLFTYLQPLVYIPLSVLWLKESFSPLIFVALPIIALGVYMAERRPRVR